MATHKKHAPHPSHSWKNYRPLCAVLGTNGNTGAIAGRMSEVNCKRCEAMILSGAKVGTTVTSPTDTTQTVPFELDV